MFGVSLALAGIFSALLWTWPTRAQDTQTATTEVDTGEIKDSISSLEKKINKEEAKLKNLQENLGTIQSSVNATQSAINKTQAAIKQAEEDIRKKEEDIRLMEEKIQLQRDVLVGVLQEYYFVKKLPLAGALLTDGISQLYSGATQLSNVQEQIVQLSKDISESKNKIDEEKVSIEETLDDHEKLLAVKATQKQELLADKNETLDDIESQQNKLDKLNKELSELQGDLNKILGRSYNVSDIKDAVSFASKKTGVPKGFLYGMLKMETNLGANVGGCTYAQVESGAEANYKKGKLSKTSWTTFQKRREIFKDICEELDIDYKKQKVSCNPSGYTGTGGAMGVAQFMPDTWVGYKSAVASLTGNNPPSPWSLVDGVSAMALKLKKTPGVTDGSKSALKKAACSYLGTCYAPYINGILYWADNYEKLL